MFDARDDIIDLFEKRIFGIKIMHLKQKKKKTEEESEGNKLEKIKYDYKNLSNMLRMNQRVLSMSCLKIILIL